MISVFGSCLGEEEVEAVAESIRSQWLGKGKKVDRFEAELAQRLGLPNMLMCSSGSNALYLAVYLLNLPKGSEVILPSFTWVSCAHAVKLCGLQPVFCDVEADSGNVSVDTIKPHITPNTSAIMVVHYAGKAVDMDPILELGLPVIEDAAHAIDSKYKGRYCGSMGAIGMYSFDAIKNLTTGEGGGLTFKNTSWDERARQLRYCGIGKSGFQQAQESASGRWWEYHLSEPFIKMLPTDLTAAIGLEQLKKLDSFQQKRKAIFEYYNETFADVEGILTPAGPADDETHSYFTYLIRVEGKSRDELAQYLYDNGIYTTLRYHPLHLNPLYATDYDLPVTEQLNETALNIPLHASLKEEDYEKVARTIIEFV